jgi:hypothetical protein
MLGYWLFKYPFVKGEGFSGDDLYMPCIGDAGD